LEAIDKFKGIDGIIYRLDTIEAYARLQQSGGTKNPTKFDDLEKKIIDDRIELKEGQSTFQS
jgi:hypothetical protein